MGLNLPGVGGGFLAAAGAVGGAGQGLAQVGQEQMKADLASKMNDLQQKREEAITRLQGQQQSGLEEQRAGHEEQRTEKEIAGKSAVAQFERGSIAEENTKNREQTHTENAAKFANETERAKITAKGRTDSAKIRAVASAKPVKGWTRGNETYGGTIGKDGSIIGGKQLPVLYHPDGRPFVQVGGGKDADGNELGGTLIPFDSAAEGGLSFNPQALRRASSKDVQKLLTNPTAILPSGASARDSFLNRYHYLPASFMSAEYNARQQQAGGGGGGGGGDEPDTSESQDQNDSESGVPMTVTPPSQ